MRRRRCEARVLPNSVRAPHLSQCRRGFLTSTHHFFAPLALTGRYTLQFSRGIAGQIRQYGNHLLLQCFPDSIKHMKVPQPCRDTSLVVPRPMYRNDAGPWQRRDLLFNCSEIHWQARASLPDTHISMLIIVTFELLRPLGH